MWIHEHELSLLEPATGARRWAIELPDRADYIYTDSQRLWVDCADHTQHFVALADGSISPAPADAPEGMTSPRGNRPTPPRPRA